MAKCKVMSVKGAKRKLCWGSKMVKGCNRGGIVSNTSASGGGAKAKKGSKKGSTKTFLAKASYAKNKDGSVRKGCTPTKKRGEYRCRKPGK